MWAYKFGQMSRLYLRGWFCVDLVRKRSDGVAVQRVAAARVRGLRSLGSCRTAPLTACVRVPQMSILPFDLVGFFLDQSSVSQLKVLRVVRLMRLVKLVRIAKASRYVCVRARYAGRPLAF